MEKAWELLLLSPLWSWKVPTADNQQ